MKKILNIAIITAMIFAWVSVFVIPTSAQGIQTSGQNNTLQRIHHNPARYPNKLDISATSREDGLFIKKTVSCDYQAPILKPWYDCNNKYRGNLKLDGWKTEMCVQNVEVFISENQLRDNGYVPIAKNPRSIGLVDPPADSINESSKDFLNNLGFWDGLALWLLGWLLVILLVALLYKLLRGDFNSKAPVPATSTPTPPTPPTMKEKSDAMSNAIKSMNDNNVAEGEVSFGEGVTGKFTFKSEKKSKVVNQTPDIKKQ